MIEVQRDNRKPAPTVENAAGLARVPISSNVRYVKWGCPLRPSDGGWVPARDGYGELVASDAGWGGETIQAARILVLNLNERSFNKFPVRLRIRDIDDSGGIVFEEAEAGPYMALDDRRVLMDMSYSAIFRMLAIIAMRIKETTDNLEQIRKTLDEREG